MSEVNAHIYQALKAARAKKGLNQRDLSQMTDVPQSHISKIENGAVDLRVSSLISLARALGHELLLVPRELLRGIEMQVDELDQPLKFKEVPSKYELDDEEDAS